MPHHLGPLRPNVGIVLINEQKKLFFAKRCGKKNAWQFPQGGIDNIEEPLTKAMYRELYEEIGLRKTDTELLSKTIDWLWYYFPPDTLMKGNKDQHYIGQKQQWFLLRLKTTSRDKINFNTTDHPEFIDYRFVDYWQPLIEVVAFKRLVYLQVLKEFEAYI